MHQAYSVSALQLFCDDKKTEVRTANPNGNLISQFSAAWKACDPKEKAKYVALHQVSNCQYKFMSSTCLSSDKLYAHCESQMHQYKIS